MQQGTVLIKWFQGFLNSCQQTETIETDVRLVWKYTEHLCQSKWGIAHCSLSLSFTQEVLADWWPRLSQYGKMAARCWSAAVFSERGKGGRSFPLALQADQVSLTPRCVIPQSWHRIPKQVHFIVALPQGWAQINARSVHRAEETPQKCRPEPGCRAEREFLLNRNERWSQRKPERHTGELHLLRCRCKIWVNARLRSSFWFHINTVSFFVHI